MAHNHHHDCRNDGDQYAEILEVDVVDDPQERTLRISILKSGEAERDRSINQHSEDTQCEADNHRPQRAFGVHTLEKHTEEEHDKNGRREISLHSLQIRIQAGRALDHRNPGQCDQHHCGCCHSANADKLMLR